MIEEANVPVAWACFSDARGLDENLVYRDRERAEAASMAFGAGVILTVKPLYVALAATASDTTPSPLPGPGCRGVGD